MKKHRVWLICLGVCVLSFAANILPYALGSPVVPNPWFYLLFTFLSFSSLIVLTFYLAFGLAWFFNHLLESHTRSTVAAIASSVITFVISILVIVAVIAEGWVGLLAATFAPASTSRVSADQVSYWVSPGFPDPDFPGFHRVIGPFWMSADRVNSPALAQVWDERFDTASPTPDASIDEATPTPAPSQTSVPPSASDPEPTSSRTAEPRQWASSVKGACSVSVEEAGQGNYQAVWSVPGSGSATHTVPISVSYRELTATCVTDTVAVISWTDLEGAYLLVTTDAGASWQTPNLPDPDGVGAYGRYFQEASVTGSTISILLDYPEWEPASVGGWWFDSTDGGMTWSRR